MTQDPEKTGREILPVPDIPAKGKIAIDARDAEFPPIKPLRPPEDDTPGGGGTGTIYVNEEKVAEAMIEKTVPFIFSADETMDVGGDLALPVTDDYPEGEDNQFSGKIHWVRVDLEEDNVSHLEPEELKYHRAFARQQPKQTGESVFQKMALLIFFLVTIVLILSTSRNQIPDDKLIHLGTFKHIHHQHIFIYCVIHS